MNFGKNLKSLMTDENITQTELAKKIGYTQRAVSKWVNGQAEPTESAIIKCAKYFNITADELLGISSISETNTPTPTVSAIHAGAALSEKEKALLKAFKNLLPETQDFVLRSVQSLSETNVEKSFKKS